MERIYVGERAVSPATGITRWVVVDSRTYGLQTEAVAYLASLRARGCSPNTERAYAGRVALYLNYCLMQRLDWRTPGFLGLAGLQQWLVGTTLSSRTSEARPGPARYRSRGTANAVVVCGYLPLTARVMVDEVCERGTEALFVGAALMGAGAVREGVELSRGQVFHCMATCTKIVLSSFSDSKPMAGEWTRLGG